MKGWEDIRPLQRKKQVTRLANQSKLYSFSLVPMYTYWYQVPRNYWHANELDDINKNTTWQDYTKLEISQVNEYDTVIDYVKRSVLVWYKQIKVHLIFDIKYDGRYKVIYVEDWCSTNIPVDIIYSGVVSLRGLRTMLFLAELNQLYNWFINIGNTYLKTTKYKQLYIIAGPYFSDKKGSNLVIFHVLYGLRSRGVKVEYSFSRSSKIHGFYILYERTKYLDDRIKRTLGIFFNVCRLLRMSNNGSQVIHTNVRRKV